MNWYALDALETKYSAINALLVVEVAQRRVVMSNSLALQYFSIRDNEISLQKTLGREMNLEDLFQSVKERLEEKIVTILENTEVESNDGDIFSCHISFTYATPKKNYMFIKIHPIFDNRPYYLEKFIESRSRPAFSLNINENLTINHGNNSFFQAFACNKASMKLRYKNYFGNLLSEENRQEYEGLIFESLKTTPVAKLDIPVRTAQGETLYFYYDSLRLQQVEDDYKNNLFCLLVREDETQEDLSNPFDTKKR